MQSKIYKKRFCKQKKTDSKVFELGKEIGRYVFSSNHERKTKKKF